VYDLYLEGIRLKPRSKLRYPAVSPSPSKTNSGVVAIHHDRILPYYLTFTVHPFISFDGEQPQVLIQDLLMKQEM
jgi:hypothetical protein